MKHYQEVPIIIHYDNQCTISMTKNFVFHGHTRHIKIRHHFIKELVLKGTIKMIYCSIKEQLANIFTESLSLKKF